MNETATTEQIEIVTYNPTDAELLEKHGFLSTESLDALSLACEEVVDMSTSKGYKRNAELIRPIREARVSLENGRKFFKADVLSLGRLIDSTSKETLAKLQKIEQPLLARKLVIDEEKKKAEEEKVRIETERLNTLNKSMSSLREYRENCYGLSSYKLEAFITLLEAEVISETVYQEKVEEALFIKSDSLRIIKDLLETTRNNEQEDRDREAERLRLKEERKALESEKAELAKPTETIMDKIKKPFASGGAVDKGPLKMLGDDHVRMEEGITPLTEIPPEEAIEPRLIIDIQLGAEATDYPDIIRVHGRGGGSIEYEPKKAEAK